MKKKKETKNPHVGSSFDDFLEEQEVIKECECQALKEILADPVRKAMEEQRVSKTAMAERMKTSRRQRGRLLDPAVPSITLA